MERKSGATSDTLQMCELIVETPPGCRATPRPAPKSVAQGSQGMRKWKVTRKNTRLPYDAPGTGRGGRLIQVTGTYFTSFSSEPVSIWGKVHPSRTRVPVEATAVSRAQAIEKKNTTIVPRARLRPCSGPQFPWGHDSVLLLQNTSFLPECWVSVGGGDSRSSVARG